MSLSSAARTVKVVPVVYDGTDATDFKRKLPLSVGQGENAIFLFNDNFMDRTRESPGANSAAIRPCAFSEPARALGIPTGWSKESGGFEELNQSVKIAITCAFERLNHVLHDQPEFNTIYYPADAKDNDNFGFSLFAPCEEVKKYLKKHLRAIPERLNEAKVTKYTKIDATEHKMEDVAILEMITHMPASKKQKRMKATMEEAVVAVVEDDEDGAGGAGEAVATYTTYSAGASEVVASVARG